MATTRYQNYLRDVFALTRTLVIKFSHMADLLNQTLQTNGYEVDSLDPSSWIYYKNKQGEYHQYDHDRLTQLTGHPYMQIQVATDQGPVWMDFTKDLLDSATGDLSLRTEYRPGSNFHVELIRRYPEFIDLISGILNPLDSQDVIDADDGDILYASGRRRSVVNDHVVFAPMDDHLGQAYLIETQEHSLLIELENYIKGCFRNWYNPNYNDYHTLNPVAFLAVLYSTLPMEILNIRLKYSNTPEVHTHHMWSRLESNGYLGEVVDYLPRSIAYHLYRNQAWYETHAGQTDTLQRLVDQVLTPLNIPMLGYRIAHQVDQINKTLTPKPVLTAQPINSLADGSQTSAIYTMLTRERGLAKYNSLNLVEHSEEIASRICKTQQTLQPTKVLDVTLEDTRTDADAELGAWLFSHWVYATNEGLYRGVVYVDHPLDGHRLQLTVKSALLLYVYAQLRAWGYAPNSISGLPYYKIPKPSVDYQTVAQSITNPEVEDRLIEALCETETVSFDALGKEAFVNMVETHHARYVQRIKLIQSQPYIDQYLGLKQGLQTLYRSNDSTLGVIDYSEWLPRQGVDTTGFSAKNYQSLADALVDAACGVDSTTQRLINMHGAVKKALTRYLSYTSHLVGEVQASMDINVGHSKLRYTKPKFRSKFGGQAGIRIQHTQTLVVRRPTHLIQDLTIDVGWKININTGNNGGGNGGGGNDGGGDNTNATLLQLSGTTDTLGLSDGSTLGLT